MSLSSLLVYLTALPLSPTRSPVAESLTMTHGPVSEVYQLIPGEAGGAAAQHHDVAWAGVHQAGPGVVHPAGPAFARRHGGASTPVRQGVPGYRSSSEYASESKTSRGCQLHSDRPAFELLHALKSRRNPRKAATFSSGMCRLRPSRRHRYVWPCVCCECPALTVLPVRVSAMLSVCCRCPRSTAAWRCCCWRRSSARPGRRSTRNSARNPSPLRRSARCAAGACDRKDAAAAIFVDCVTGMAGVKSTRSLRDWAIIRSRTGLWRV